MTIEDELLALVPAAQDIVKALFEGNAAEAERQARVLAETVAAKAAIHAAYLAGHKGKP
jgi:hypothetical protein